MELEGERGRKFWDRLQKVKMIEISKVARKIKERERWSMERVKLKEAVLGGPNYGEPHRGDVRASAPLTSLEC